MSNAWGCRRKAAFNPKGELSIAPDHNPKRAADNCLAGSVIGHIRMPDAVMPNSNCPGAANCSNAGRITDGGRFGSALCRAYFERLAVDNSSCSYKAI